MASPQFTVVGKLAVLESATVICLRNVGRTRSLLRLDHFGLAGAREKPGYFSSLGNVFRDLNEFEFSSGWEVLMGQSECVNWVRSKSLDQLKTMRYAGEYKFAGGNIDGAETFLQAARRELEEEFLRPAGVVLPQDALIRPFVVKQTMPVQSKSNIMWNMVALAEENAWLRHLDVDAANAKLEERRVRFKELLNTGEFWSLSTAAREAVAPEVRELQWIPLAKAFFLTMSTMVGGGTLHFVNAWQQAEFERLGISRRDPMFMTACTLLEVEAFPSVACLVDHCNRIGAEDGMQAERERVQWLFPGMTDSDVKAGGKDGRGEPTEMVKDARTIAELREQRAASRPQEARL